MPLAEVLITDAFFKLLAAGPLFFVSAWLLMIFAGIASADTGTRPFSYITSMVVTIAGGRARSRSVSPHRDQVQPSSWPSGRPVRYPAISRQRAAAGSRHRAELDRTGSGHRDRHPALAGTQRELDAGGDEPRRLGWRHGPSRHPDPRRCRSKSA